MEPHRPTPRPLPREARLAMLGAAVALALAAPARRGCAAPPGGPTLRLEVGASTDLTNEQFYEDALVDSLSLGRRLVDSPEARAAMVLFGSVSGSRPDGTARYQFQNELSLGNLLRRNLTSGTWRAHLSPDWTLQLVPRVEYRHDRTFDRDLEEWRASTASRLRRSLADLVTAIEAQAAGDLLRATGAGADYLLDRNEGRWALGVDHAPLFGAAWRVGYRGAARAFPDSSERDHLEHGWEGHWRRDFDGGAFLLLDTDGARRVTLRPAPTSRDRFWHGEAAVEAGIRPAAALSWQVRLAAEMLRYDAQDDTSFYDYQILGGRCGPRLERGAWSLGGGPRGEALRSPRDPGEQYRELGGWLEVELLRAGAWWSVSPAAGWRDYSEADFADTTRIPSLHSSYAFYELSVLADHALSEAVRVRLFASARLESHIDRAQDARSLYFSLDVRRLF